MKNKRKKRADIDNELIINNKLTDPKKQPITAKGINSIIEPKDILNELCLKIL